MSMGDFFLQLFGRNGDPPSQAIITCVTILTLLCRSRATATLDDNISGPETRLWDANTPCISTASLPRFEAALALNLAAFDRLFGYYSAPKYVFYFILFYLFKIILFPGSVVHALLPASASNALLTASQRPSRATLSSSVTRAAPVPCPRCDTVLSLVSLYATIWHPRAR